MQDNFYNTSLEIIELLLPKLNKCMYTCTMYVIYPTLDVG